MFEVLPFALALPLQKCLDYWLIPKAEKMRQVCAKSTAALLGFAVVSFGLLAHFCFGLSFASPGFLLLMLLVVLRHFLGGVHFDATKKQAGTEPCGS